MSVTPLDNAYKEIGKLAQMLENAEIQHRIDRWEDGWQLMYPERGEKCVCSVVEFTGSYGAKMDRLEIKGLLNAEERKHDRVCGWLTAENVFDRIQRDWDRRKKRHA